MIRKHTLTLPYLLVLSLVPALTGATGRSTIPLAPPTVLAAQYAGPAALVQAMIPGQATPLAMQSADLDGDGAVDLIAGYRTANGSALAVYWGNPDAFAPRSPQSFQAIGSDRFAPPFMGSARVFAVPAEPDFLAVGNFTGSGGPEVALAAHGGNTVYILGLNRNRELEVIGSVDAGAPITALSAGSMDMRRKYSQALVGVRDGNGARLLVYSGSGDGLIAIDSRVLDGDAAAVAYGDVDGDGIVDAAVVAGQSLYVLAGSEVRAAADAPGPSNRPLEAIGVPFPVAGIALGRFSIDRDPGQELAVLGTDGTLHIFDRKESGRSRADSKAWTEAESFTIGAAATSRLFPARLSGNPSEDVLLVDPVQNSLTLISHPNANAGGTIVNRRESVNGLTAAVSQRVNVDGRRGVVFLGAADPAPRVLAPLPAAVFTVDSDADSADANPGDGICADSSNRCTLRAAVMESNAAAGVTTILTPAGVYSLTSGRLPVTKGVNIVGADAAATVIQAGPDAGSGTDAVFAINPNRDRAFETSFANLTIQSGRNATGQGGGLQWDAGGNGSLWLSQCTISGNLTTAGNGGGVAATNARGGDGLLTIDSTTIENNSASGAGGGIFAGPGVALSITAARIQKNQAGGDGGGIAIDGTRGTAGSAVHASSILANTAGSHGGGVRTGRGVLIDQGTKIDGNQALEGGGVWQNAADETTALRKVTLTANAAVQNGGGASGNNLDIRYSRIANNTAASGVGIDAGAGAATAARNWWGCNEGPLSSLCDGVAGAVAVEPWITLNHTASPGRLKVGDTTTLSGSFAKDSAGGVIPAGNLDAIANLPTFENAVNGTVSPASPGSARFTATTEGRGKADAILDHAIVTVPIIIGNGSPGSFLSFAKSFGAASIALNGSTSLTLSLTTNGFDESSIYFTDPLPAGLVVATPNGLLVSGQCGGPSVTANAGSGAISFSGGSIIDPGLCTVTVNVTGVTAGTQNNVTGIVSSDFGPGSTAEAGINVAAPPTIAKAFAPSSIGVNATTTLTFTVTNPSGNTVALTGVGFTDVLPAGLTVTNGSAGTCGGTGTTSAPDTISLTGATIAANSFCQFAVTVTGTAAGVYIDATGAVTSTNGGTGNTASATLTVGAPPSITKSFSAASITTTTFPFAVLTFSITNPNSTLALTGVAFTDNFPAGLNVAATPNLSTTCSGTTAASSGGSSVSLSGGSLAASASCSISVNIYGTTNGVKNNSVTISSTETGTGNTSMATINVVAPPTLVKGFGAASIPLNGTTSLSFTVTNPNSFLGLTGIAVADTLPAGLVISTPNGLTGSCGSGTITAVAGSGTVSLSGANVASGGSCTFGVNVTGTAAGTQSNTSGSITSNEGGTGGTASASIAVVAPPAMTTSFSPATISLNGTTSLTFTVTNPSANTVALTGVAFTDSLPTGLNVSGASAAVCGGTVTLVAPSSITLSGATVAVSSQCQFSITVTGVAAGSYTNTTGAAASTNGGTGLTASAGLTVASAPSITKAFGAATIPLSGTTTLTFTLTNPNSSLALTGLAFSDTLPAGLAVAATPNLFSTCGGTATAAPASGAVSLAGSTLASSASCTVSVTISATSAGVKNNSVQVTSTEAGTGNTANASLTVVASPTIGKAFGAASIQAGDSTSLTFTLINPNATTMLTGIAFTDALPAGLLVSTPSGLTGSCGAGSIAATPGGGVVSLSGGSLAASATCVFSVNVTGIAGGTQNNTTGNVTSAEGGTGLTASASVTVQQAATTSGALNGAAVYGTQAQPVTLTATVSSGAGTVNAGTVTFSVFFGATQIGVSTTSGTVANGTGSASFTLPGGTPAGVYSIHASYSGAGVFAASSDNTQTLTVSAAPSLVAATNVSANYNLINQSVVLSAAVSSIAGVVNEGTVTFTVMQGSNIVGAPVTSSAVTGGVVTATFTLPGGTVAGLYTIAAVLNPGPNFLTGSDNAHSLTVLAPVTINTTPAGLSYTVDDVSYAGAQTFNWIAGSQHAVAAMAPQNGGPGIQYVFAGWSDTGASAHSVNAPATSATLILTYQTQYQLTILASPVEGGSVMPASGGFFDAGSTVSIVATTNQGYGFSGWDGPVNSNQAATTVALTQATTVVARFTPPNDFTVSPGFVQQQYFQGTTPSTLTQVLAVSANQATTFSVSATTPWITVSGAGATPGTVTVTLDAGSLTPGAYDGSIVFALSDGSTNTVPVTLSVVGPPSLTASVTGLTFTMPAGSTTPQSRDFTISSLNRNVSFTASAGVSWITVSSNPGTTPATIHVTVNPAGVTASATGNVVLTAPDAVNNPLMIPVTLNVTAGAPPAGQITAVVNGASFQQGIVAPNTILSIFGTNLGCSPNPQVSVNGEAAEVLGANGTQINFVVPGDAGTTGSLSIAVVCNGTVLQTVTVSLTRADPAIFTAAQNGSGPGAILNQDGSLNSAASPVKPGGFVSVYVTGFGQLGSPGSDGLRHLMLPVSAMVGNVPAFVIYAGEAPGNSSGLQQINVQIPANAPLGANVPIALNVNGVPTQDGVTIAIH